jgi:hypothetical protein
MMRPVTMLDHDLLFVAAVSSLETLRARLLASPCLQPGRRPLVVRWNAASAADALNPVLDARPAARWVVWVHQDVVLPEGWDERFLREAERVAGPSGDGGSGDAGSGGSPASGQAAVLGVYGVSGTGEAAIHAGCVLDRGQWLRGPAPLPCQVDSLDEMLFAVPGDSPLRLDPAMGFDLYATDLVLQAQARGLNAQAIDAPCEHWSDTPERGPMPAALIDRVARSGDAFEAKWARRLPVQTPCFAIHRGGDVRRIAESFPRA